MIHLKCLLFGLGFISIVAIVTAALIWMAANSPILGTIGIAVVVFFALLCVVHMILKGRYG